MPSTPMWKVTQVATGVAGAPYYFVGYFDQAAGTAQQAADAWRAFLGTTAGNHQTPYAFQPITVVDLVDPVDGDLLGTANVSVGSLQFTSTTFSLPASNQVVVGWRTGVYINGREVRGRTNIARIPVSGADAQGAVNPTLATTIQGRITTLLSNATADFVLWSKKNGTWETVTSGYTAANFGVLRSRRD